MADDPQTFTITMTEEELDRLLDKLDKWNLHVRNAVLDLADRARLQIITQEKTPQEAYDTLREQVTYQFGHNREILQNHVALVMRGGKVRAFTNGSKKRDG